MYQKIFRKANFSYADLEGVRVENMDFSGINLRNANLKEAVFRNTQLKKASLSRANLDRAFLREIDLTGTNLKEASLIETDLRNANLRLANFDDANLTKANLNSSILEFTSFKRATMEETELNYAICKSEEELASLWFDDVGDLESDSTDNRKVKTYPTSFKGANLKKANFSGAILYGANFYKANLEGALFTEAFALKADFLDASFYNTNFNKAYIDLGVIKYGKADTTKILLEDAKVFFDKMNEYMPFTDDGARRQSVLKYKTIEEKKFLIIDPYLEFQKMNYCIDTINISEELSFCTSRLGGITFGCNYLFNKDSEFVKAMTSSMRASMKPHESVHRQHMICKFFEEELYANSTYYFIFRKDTEGKCLNPKFEINLDMAKINLRIDVRFDSLTVMNPEGR